MRGGGKDKVRSSSLYKNRRSGERKKAGEWYLVDEGGGVQ